MSRAGFTLLELLVGIVVLGLVLLGLTGGTRYGLRAAETQSRLAESRGDLDAADRTLRRTLAAATPAAGQVGTLRGGAGTLQWVSALPDGTQAEFGLGVDGARRLVLRTSPRVPGKRLGPAPAPEETELAGGIAGLQLSYWTPAGGGRWLGTWGEPTLPALVRIRIRFREGDSRHWPDLIVAPMRSRAGGPGGAAPSVR